MKYSNWTMMRFTLTLLSILAIGLLSNCDKNDTPVPSKEEEVKELLTSATWKVNTVSVDAVDKTIVYKDLSLSFSDGGFTSVQGAAIWPATGTWKFTSETATAFVRDDGVTVTIQEITDTSLKLALTWTKNTLTTGRSMSVSGSHVFSFKK